MIPTNQACRREEHRKPFSQYRTIALVVRVMQVELRLVGRDANPDWLTALHDDRYRPQLWRRWIADFARALRRQSRETTR